MNNCRGGAAAPVNLNNLIQNSQPYLFRRNIFVLKSAEIFKIKHKLRSAFSFKNQLNIFIWQVISFLANLAPPGLPLCI